MTKKKISHHGGHGEHGARNENFKFFSSLRGLRVLRGEIIFTFLLVAFLTHGSIGYCSDKVRISVTSYNMSYLAAGVAAKQGIFKEERLEVETQRTERLAGLHSRAND